MTRTCGVCGGTATRPFVDAGQVPLQCTALYDERSDALDAPLGRMQLIHCEHCGTVTNDAFDAALVPYDGDYENSQLFSPTFRDYASDLAERLIDDHGLRGRPVVEVGSGKGEFLAMLALAGAGRATGYDPTYGGEVDHLDPSLDIHLERTFFGETTLEHQPGLVCLRHVLEHVQDPVGMLSDLREAVKGDPECLFYVEVPNADFTFTPSGLWDIIYQHCSYFTPAALRWVAAAAGFDVAELRPAFEGQFLALFAHPATGDADNDVLGGAANEDESLAAFSVEYQRLLEEWRGRLDAWVAAGQHVALWGAGAKGVTFLNIVGAAVDTVVDVNVRKHGRFLPGTGHQVAAPSALVDTDVDVVIVMNPAYETEIRAELHALGLDPRLEFA